MNEKIFKIGDRVTIEYSSYKDGSPGIWEITEIFNQSYDSELQYEACIKQGNLTRIEYIDSFIKD